MLRYLRTIFLVAVFFTTAGQCFAAQPDEKISTRQDQGKVMLTIYNDDLALIKEQRTVRLDKGKNRLAWREVSAQMRPETALLRNLTSSANLRLLEQNFDFDLLTPQKLLEKYLGRNVVIIHTNPATGEESREEATVLSSSQGVVLKFADRIETGLPGRITFPDVPSHLRDQPTLSLLLATSSAGNHELELSYLTTGLSWRADYVAELNADDSMLAMNGLVTLVNRSGIAYKNARLQLVAGNVNRAWPDQQHRAKSVEAVASMMTMAPAMEQESLFAYHLYSLPTATTLADNQTKQVGLMSASDIVVRKKYQLRGADYYFSGKYGEIGRNLHPAVMIEFSNKGEGLGIPLPKGIIRVYKKDSRDNVQFIGEDRIEHTARNELVNLNLGSAFDITADKTQTEFRQLASTPQHHVETAYQIRIRNALDEAVTIQIQEPIPGDWTMVETSLPHTQPAANLAQWQVNVPANQETVLSYRVRVRFF
ncbi:MAG: DUF4139 domain-containing protein [Nitrosomonas sp.]|nr:DUF4139 domain-containing protein [Nitrosomonas sp.]